MQAYIDPEACTGCGLCADICPEVFEMGDDIAEVIAEPIPKASEESSREAEESCPTEAITLED